MNENSSLDQLSTDSEKSNRLSPANFDYEGNNNSPSKSISAQSADIPELAEDDEETPIDDDEFNIPAVDFEPSLESILNNDDDQSISDDDITVGNNGQTLVINQFGTLPEGSDTISIISKGSSDNRSRSSSKSMKPKSNQAVKKKPSSILRHVLLKGMTSHLNAVADKINAGTATAVTIGTLIAIGTSHGYCLVFDSMQLLKWCLGEAHHREDGGSVSSLAVSGNGTRLLVGYAKGLILMYDLENGKLIRAMHDAHAPITAVLILRFTDYPILALCSDSGGSVFEMNFKRTMGVRGCDARCIFSGSRGEVCTFEPLILSNYPDNPLTRYVIVALATLSKIIVVMIRPKLKVLFTHPLTSDPTTLPLLAWQMVIIQTTKNEKIVDPVLTFARENSIYFYQVTLGSKNSVKFLPLQKITVNYQLLSLHWLNSRTISLLDTKENLRVMDVRSQEELESIDLSQTRLVYASSHFKGLATGGNVSRAFAIAGERACYNSILCFNNQMVVLGTKSVHALTMRSWHERLDYLVRQHHFVEALQLGYELYLEKAKAVIGLKGTKDSKKLIIRDKMLYILDRYVDRISSLNLLEDLNTAKQNYHEIISSCINYYVLLNHIDPVVDKLYELSAYNPISKSAYLEALEPFILNDQLRSIPPTIVKEFVCLYDEMGKYKPLEACVVHINVESLDIHQTMKLCWTQGLYDAIIYIYNQGMKDYVSPLEELMTELQSALMTDLPLTDSQIALGNKMLVYISCCLAGRAYPYGNIDFNLVEKVQSDIFRIITTLHSRNSTENEQSYPYLRTFLRFDTREFLNVLSLSFEEPVFQTELGRRQKQRMVDILLQVMVEQGNFTPTQVGVLFTFLARQMARAENSLYVSKLLFEQVLEHLTSANEKSRVDERQQALLELLLAGGMQHFDHQKLLDKCYNAKFFRVCEMLYERQQNYHKIINCYILDDSRQQQVFSFLQKMFCLMPEEKENFQKNVKENLEKLVEIDNKKTAQIIYLHMGTMIPDLVKCLEHKPEKLYLFLQGVFNTREQNHSGIQVDILTTEKYVELLSRFSPPLVYPFLKSIESYRLEQTMDICKKYKLVEAMGYLLEKDGKILEAFDLMMNQFNQKLSQIFEEIEKLEAEASNSKEDTETLICSNLSWTQLQALFLVMVQFSQRNSPKMISEERDKLWLPLLELLITAHNKSKLGAAFNDMTKHLLSSMMGHVSLPTIVEIVMNDPSYHKAAFSEIKDLVLGMLDTCTYEEMMVTLVKRITQSDVHDKLSRKVRSIRKGFSPKNKKCPACHTYLTPDFPPKDVHVVVFHCGHSYHYTCCEEGRLTTCSICRILGSTSAKVREPESPEETNVSFQIPKKNSSSSEDYSDEDSLEQLISHSEFELKTEGTVKVSLQSKN